MVKLGVNMFKPIGILGTDIGVSNWSKERYVTLYHISSSHNKEEFKNGIIPRYGHKQSATPRLDEAVDIRNKSVFAYLDIRHDFIGKQWFTPDMLVAVIVVPIDDCYVADCEIATDIYENIPIWEDSIRLKKLIDKYKKSIMPLSKYHGQYKYPEVLIPRQIMPNEIVEIKTLKEFM